MKRAIRRNRTFPHPPTRVWQAITSSDALAAWLMPNDFEARVGHRFQFRTDPAPGFDGIVHCEVLELEEPRRMVWSWRGGPIETTVTFELQPEADGTRLSFSQEGFEGLHGCFVSLILESGFRKMFRHSLPAVLDRLARDEDPALPLHALAKSLEVSAIAWRPSLLDSSPAVRVSNSWSPCPAPSPIASRSSTPTPVDPIAPSPPIATPP